MNPAGSVLGTCLATRGHYIKFLKATIFDSVPPARVPCPFRTALPKLGVLW